MPEPGGPGRPVAPPIFGRSLNPIQTGEGRLSPPITTGTPNVFHLPASLLLYFVACPCPTLSYRCRRKQRRGKGRGGLGAMAPHPPNFSGIKKRTEINNLLLLHIAPPSPRFLDLPPSLLVWNMMPLWIALTDRLPSNLLFLMVNLLALQVSQTTIPYIDSQPVAPQVGSWLSGVGLYHKGTSGSGGYVGAMIKTYDISRHLVSKKRDEQKETYILSK